MKIFLLTSERSGSNLLRTLLGKHNEVEAPVAPHLFREFYCLIDLYGDLDKYENKYDLVQDMFNLVNYEYHSWNLPDSTVVKAMKLKGLNNLARIIDFFYLEKANLENKTGYCSKGIHNFDFAHYIKTEIPEAKFIYLTRDPRGVTASWLKTPLHLHTPFKIVKQWNDQQFICRRFQACYPKDVVSLRYEDLIENTEVEMTRVQEALGLDVDERCFTTNKDNQEAKNNELWKNLNKPIIKGNASKFLTTLSSDDINIIESVARENMLACGYTNFHAKGDWTPGNYLLFKIKEKYRTRQSILNRGDATQKVLDRVKGKVEVIKNVRKRLVERDTPG
jgi:hypothetical protein